MDGLVNRNASGICHKTVTSRFLPTGKLQLNQYVIESADWKWIDTMEDAMTAILSGNTVLFWMEKQEPFYFQQIIPDKRYRMRIRSGDRWSQG